MNHRTISGLGGTDGAVVFLFIVMAIVGLVMAVKSLNERD